MTIFFHEMKRGRLSLAVWTASIAVMIVICLLVFPEIQGAESIDEMFASMGSFTDAFGMDQIHFGDPMGYYGIECGNVLGLGGALFAALIGVSMLSGEEKNHTAEFLLTHPVKRGCVVGEKLAAAFAELLLFHLGCFGASLAAFAYIGEEVRLSLILLLHGAYFLLHIQLCAVCFGISAFLRQSGAGGVGIGIAVGAYFLNLVRNLWDGADFLRWLTPFSYADAADLLTRESLDLPLAAVGMAFAALAVSAAFWYWTRKDIAA